MSTAARITALFVAIATVFALLVTAFLAQRDYHRTLDAIVAEAPERVRSHPQVQLHIYNEREFMLDQFLAGYLDNEAVAGRRLEIGGEAGDMAATAQRNRRRADIAGAPKL